jgi:hypothetical protein
MTQHNNFLRNSILIWIIVIGTFCSCNGFLDVDSNHAASETEQWNKVEDVRAALMGVYGLTRVALSENNTHWVCGDLRMGDFTVYNRTDLQAIVDNDLRKSHSRIEEICNWRRFYAAINAASELIEKAPAVTDRDRSYSDEHRRYDVAQAKSVRAFLYFYLVRMFGDVPLITQSFDNGTFPKFGKSSSKAALDFAKSELLAAVPELPYLYGTSSNLYYGSSNNYWKGVLFNKLSAYALLAHIAAYEGNYADTETYSSYIMTDATQIDAAYTAIANLCASTGLFGTTTLLTGSRIIGFPSSFTYKEATYSGHIEELTLAAPFVQKTYPEIYITKDRLLEIFDDVSDLRFGIDTVTMKYSTYYINDVNAEYPVFSKIKVIQDANAADGDYAVFGSSIIFTRLEEIALLRAEALTALNKPEDGLSLLNEIRVTRGLKTLSYRNDFGYDIKALMNSIFNERKRELLGEGWSWYDRIRRQKLLRDDPGFLQLIESGGVYLPIAEDVIANNSEIEQNDYWK